MRGRVNQCDKLHWCLILRNCHSHPQSLATSILINQQSSTSRQYPPPEGEILAPQPGLEPMPPAVEVQSLNHSTARECDCYTQREAKKFL